MRTTITYENDVKQKYLNDKKHGKLRGNLYKLTPKTIKTICLNIVDDILGESDRSIMKNYFLLKKEEDLRLKIMKYDIDGFRPICKFLTGKTESIKSPDALELISLIIDFTPRPYNNYRLENIHSKTKDIEEKRETSSNDKREQLANENKRKEDDDGDIVIIAPIDLSEGKHGVNESVPDIDRNSVEENDGNNYGKSNKSDNSDSSNGHISSFMKKTGKKESLETKSLGINIKIIVISSIILLSAIIIIPLNKTRWMIWQDGEYVEVTFDMNKYDFGKLKLYKKERILYFKQIKNPNCDTEFFKANGKPNAWYGRNTKGELELFKSYGEHPETGNTLKKITKHMIRTYICDTYK